MIHLKTGLMAVVCAALASCTELPINGPQTDAIHSGAATSLKIDTSAPVLQYALVDLSNRVVEEASDIGPGSFYKSYGVGKGPAPEILVGVGDVLQVTIFESAVGGLFIPADAGVRPGNYVTLPNQVVDRTGTISVPYAGAIPAQGRSLPQIQKDIEQKLAHRAIEPQVIVSIVSQTATEVSVLGEVNSPKKFSVRANGMRILDAIADAGGIKNAGYESFVTLQRDRRRATVFFDSLVRHPEENIYVAPGDILYVYREPRKFVAVGAVTASAVNLTAQTALFSFEQSNLSLVEGVARAGGLLDDRADPGQVFLYRMEDRKTLEHVGVDLSSFPRHQHIIPTIYRSNFRDPASYFLAQNLKMRNKDVIYVSNAESVEVNKALAYLRSITGTISGVTADAAGVRRSGHYLFTGRD
jgi:polysaccharide biosynthesis/export protein